MQKFSIVIVRPIKCRSPGFSHIIIRIHGKQKQIKQHQLNKINLNANPSKIKYPHLVPIKSLWGSYMPRLILGFYQKYFEI